MQIFGLRLKEIREERGLSVSSVANILNISTKTLNNWEQNIDEPKMLQLFLLTVLLNISADYLIGISDNKSQIYSKNQLNSLISVYNKSKKYE